METRDDLRISLTNTEIQSQDCRAVVVVFRFKRSKEPDIRGQWSVALEGRDVEDFLLSYSHTYVAERRYKSICSVSVVKFLNY